MQWRIMAAWGQQERDKTHILNFAYRLVQQDIRKFHELKRQIVIGQQPAKPYYDDAIKKNRTKQGVMTLQQPNPYETLTLT